MRVRCTALETLSIKKRGQEMAQSQPSLLEAKPTDPELSLARHSQLYYGRRDRRVQVDLRGMGLGREMNLRYSVEEMIKMFGATYRTIDIRSAAVKQGEAWTNVYAVARLSYEEPALAMERLRRLERTHGAISTESFRAHTK